MKKASQAVPNKLLINERLQRRWSQKEVAELVGTTTINVSRWERGVTAPNAYFRHQLRILFDKSEEELGLIPLRVHKSGDLSTEPLTYDQEILTPPQSLSSHKSGDLSTEPLTYDQEIQPSSPSLSSSFWHVPFQRNLLFTGRESILLSIHHIFHIAQNAALRHSCILSGMGGIGTTQIALEYAYRYRQNYQTVLWIDASTLETLATSIAPITNLLTPPHPYEQQQMGPVAIISHWLQTYTGWLLVLDSAEDTEIITPLLSIAHNNYILLTTRAQTTGMIVSHIEIEQMEREEGTLFLLRRARSIRPEATLEDAPESLRIHAEYIVQVMGGLPLALDQTGSYIEETGCSLSSYLSLYQEQSATLLNQRGRVIAGHPETVTETFSLSIKKVEQANPIAADLLRACAFFDPDTIPEEVITEQYVPQAKDPLTFNAAIAELRKHSLIRRNAQTKTLTIHRLTKVVLLNEKRASDELPDQQILAIHERDPATKDAPGMPDLDTTSPPQFVQDDDLRPPAVLTQSSTLKHHETIIGAPAQLFKRQSRQSLTVKTAIFAIIGIVVISSFILPLIINKGQASQKTTINNLTDEMKEEAVYYQKEGIGLSDGNIIFDTYAGRTYIKLKTQAASCLRQGNTSCAVNFMTQAVSADVTDGEIHIYNENLHVLQSGAPYISIVLGLAIANQVPLLIRDREIMQAAFLAQREINTKGLLPDNLRLRILIDNSGANNAHVATAAQFIANRIRDGNPDHIVAVLGWPFSSQTINAVDIITGTQIPMISQSASSTMLSGVSPYFFRVNPTDNQQGTLLGDVAVNHFHARKILLMEDPTDPYSVSLANAFANRATELNATIIHSSIDNFSTGITTTDAYQQGVVKEAQAKNVNLIFMAGFDVDAVRLAHALGNAYRADPKSTLLANLKVMAGDAVATSLLLGYGGGADAITAIRFPQDMQRLIFSSFAHPDEWAYEKLPAAQKPDFFSDWLTAYQNISDQADISEPGDHAILTYDALMVLVRAITLARTPLTGQTIREALASLGQGKIPAFQGISGLIAFNSQGDPINKAFVLLSVEDVNGSNKIVLQQVVGNFH